MTTTYAYKVVRPDGRTRNDFRWPIAPGERVRSDDNPVYGGHVCPQHPGDGLSVGHTAYGLSLSSILSPTLLVVSYDDADVAGTDPDKSRVLGPVTVELVIDWHRAIRDPSSAPDLPGGLDPIWGEGANLRSADLERADLRGANLRGANLRSANLRGADIWGANLRGANLRRADLRRAGLERADLRAANLRGAALRGADLWDADLRGAVLDSAAVAGADLEGATLGRE